MFQKKPQVSTSAPLYTLGMDKTILIVGLGNPGKKYDGTRHNVGFMCLDAFAKTHDFDNWSEKKDLKSLVTVRPLGNVRVVLSKPQTFMNQSGDAVQKAASFYKIPPENIVVVHDDLDIDFGQIRMRMGGTDAGNNGIRSLIQHIGIGFGRIRIGVSKPQHTDAKDYVLTKFSETEKRHLRALEKEVVSILTECIYRGELQPETRSFVI